MESEFDIIRRYFTRPTKKALLGIGDDAALIAFNATTDLAISTDTLVVGQHFFADADPYQLGHKALAVNLSDMAAMGAVPRWLTLAITLPKDTPQSNSAWLQAFAQGFFALADRYQVELIGGNTTSGPLNICVQIIGEIARNKALKRSNAQPNDDIWVSGQLGNAALALAHLKQQLVLSNDALGVCLPALHTPAARVELGQHLTNLAHSAIDISDGLLADLGHILSNSNLAAVIELEAIPRSWVWKSYASHAQARDWLLSGGDDYELCFTAAKIKREKIQSLSEELAIPLTRIGKMLQGEGLSIVNSGGTVIEHVKKGYDHFLS